MLKLSKTIIIKNPVLKSFNSNNGLNNKLIKQISKTKKNNKSILNVATINISKLNAEHDGFLLYQNTDTSKTKIISLLFVFCFASGFWTYTKIEDDQIRVNYMIIGAIMVVPFLIFQFRTAKTLKRLILDKQGENIIITRYQLGGFAQQSTKAKVQILRGINKAFAFGGSVIRGGGVYGYQERSYWFQSKFILQRDIFEETVQGNIVKIDRTKIVS